jgi:serine-type D-Ala-D-Ala carboxypeptidase (penicillin-binding protein 5/6)
MAYAPRRRRRRGLAAAVLALCIVAGVVVELVRHHHPAAPARAAKPPPVQPSFIQPLAGTGTAPSPLAVRLAGGRDPVRVRFKHPPRSGLLFDVDTGRVLWRHAPTRVLPIASLTKMMTALVVDDRVPRHARVKITKQALAYQGSGVGVLPKGKRVKVRPMLYGLLLPSGNDAAIALAQRASGTVKKFVAAMNARAHAMGLVCTHYTSPSGFYDAGNHSCAGDLAAEARAILRVPRLARIVRTGHIVLPFPIKGGKLYLYNNNPLLRLGYRGTTGMKTGYTDAAGHCLVATARRGDVDLGVVLLHSPDTGTQARQLLDRGFRFEGV